MARIKAIDPKVVNYNGHDIRVIKHPSTGDVYFCVRDIVKVLGLTNYVRILNRVGEEHKLKAVLKTVNHHNPQKYWMVDKYGLASIAYRAIKTQTDPTKFFKWAEQISKKDTL